MVPSESDASYFTRRAGEERVHADHAADELTQSLHLELADRYAAVANAIRQVEKKLA
jgi:hypothetical protein